MARSVLTTTGKLHLYCSEIKILFEGSMLAVSLFDPYIALASSQFGPVPIRPRSIPPTRSIWPWSIWPTVWSIWPRSIQPTFWSIQPTFWSIQPTFWSIWPMFFGQFGPGQFGPLLGQFSNLEGKWENRGSWCKKLLPPPIIHRSIQRCC